MVEKQILLKIRKCGMIVGLQGMGNAAGRKIVRDGDPAIRRIPRNGAGPEHVPAARQRAK